MSTEDDIDAPETELKELVTQALEENGLLSKIRAQLRAGLYVALENEINETNKHCHINSSLKSHLANPEIRTMFCLVLEFLEYYGLDFTKSVFEKETYVGLLYNYDGKEKLSNELEIRTKTPLLLEILRLAQNSSKITKIIENESTFLNDVNESKDVNKTYDIPTDPKSGPEAKEETDTSVSSIESKHSDQIEIKSEKIETSLKVDNDTYEGTSSIAEDSVNDKNSLLIDLNKTARTSTNAPVETFKSLMDQTINEPFVKSERFESLLKSTPEEKNDSLSKSSSDKKSPKLSPTSNSNSDDSPKTPRPDSDKKKHDKAKPMSGLTSLSDLPPLQLNPSKTRSPDTVLLPSLYSKEFREKSNLKDIDKFLDNFDSIDNYEEDDILSTSVDYDKHKNINTILKNDNLKSFSPKKLFDKKETNGDNKNDINSNSNQTESKDNDNTSISEDLDFNSNSDEVVKSEKSDF